LRSSVLSRRPPDDWVNNYISADSFEWHGGVVIERRYVRETLDGIDAEGLTVGPWPNWEGPE
jgi:hypothetical protein